MNYVQPDLVSGLAPADAARLMKLGTPMTLTNGEALFRLGDEAANLYLIERGRIQLTLPLQVCGREENVLVEERGAGQTLGWSGLIPPHRFTLNANAPVETALIAFARGALLDHFSARPDVGYAVSRNVAAIMGHRLQVLQAMWVREMQRMVDQRVKNRGAVA
jgi:CRP/FNR family cyclic AMP-dependent transcriptional regulator